MSWEKEERERGMTRREWVQIGIGAAAVASIAGLGGLVAGQILPPPDLVPAGLPSGFNLYFDDATLDSAHGGTRILVFFDRCVHLCCYPGWHVVDNPPPGRDYNNYGASPPTFVQFQQDPIYCVCHGSQYDPMVLVVNVNDKSGAGYVGAQRVHGPAPRALPVIPVQAQGLNLVGGMANPAWYVYC